MATRATSFRKAAIAAVALAALAACSTTAPPEAKPAAEGPLMIGSVLPHTAYAGAGEALVAAVQLASDDINAAGGVFGKNVQLKQVDSTDNNDTASQAVDSLVTWGADAVIGAYGSGMSGAIVKKITDSGAIQVSGSNTSSKLTGINPLYFRTAPTDVLEAAMIADLVVKDGHASAGIIAQNDAWGNAFEEAMIKAFDTAGVKVAAKQRFNTTDTDYSAQISAIAAAKPEAVVLLSYASYSGSMISSLVGTHSYTSANVYFSNSTLGKYTVNPSLLTGMRGYLAGPDPAVATDFQARLLKVNPNLKSFAYAASTYDAVVVTSLAAIAANSVNGKDIAAKMAEVSGGTGKGEKCKTFADCAKLLQQGKTIDYDGLTGGLAFAPNNDVTQTAYQLYVYGEDGTYAVKK